MGTDAESQKGNKELLVYVLWGGVLEAGAEGKMVYNGGSRKCMVVRDGMGVEELRGMVKETVGGGVEVDRIWYSLKYDRNMIMAVEGDMDVKMMLKGNDEHGYVYVGNKESVVPRVRKNVRERRVGEGGGEEGTAGGRCRKRQGVAVVEEVEVAGGNDAMERYVTGRGV